MRLPKRSPIEGLSTLNYRIILDATFLLERRLDELILCKEALTRNEEKALGDVEDLREYQVSIRKFLDEMHPYNSIPKVMKHRIKLRTGCGAIREVHVDDKEPGDIWAMPIQYFPSDDKWEQTRPVTYRNFRRYDKIKCSHHVNLIFHHYGEA